MSHITKVVGYETLSNGQVAFYLRCCGDASTDHRVTLTVSDAADPAIRTAKLDVQRDLVAKQHEDAIQAEAGALESIGDAKEHP
jgi:hypothetical protein